MLDSEHSVPSHRPHVHGWSTPASHGARRTQERSKNATENITLLRTLATLWRHGRRRRRRLGRSVESRRGDKELCCFKEPAAVCGWLRVSHDRSERDALLVVHLERARAPSREPVVGAVCVAPGLLELPTLSFQVGSIHGEKLVRTN